MRTPVVVIAAVALVSMSMNAATSSSGLLLVANKADQTLGLIDPVTDKQIAVVAEGGQTGHEVVASPDGHTAFVPIYGNSGVGLPGTDGRTLAVIDLPSRHVTHTIDFGHGVRPHCAVFGPKDGLLYVTTELDKSVAVINPQTLKIIGSIPTGQPESHMLAISADGRFGYTANVGPGTVSVLDIAARKMLTIIPVAKHVQRISTSPDGHWVFTADTEQPRLAVIDTHGNKVERWIKLPAAGYGSASTPDGKYLFIAVPAADGVAVIDLATFQVLKTITVPHSPQEVVIRPDGQVAYVSCSAAGKVAAIKITAIKIVDWSTKTIEAGPGADGLAWAK